MAKKSRWAAKRERLWRQNPNCYYCQKPTILIRYADGVVLPANAATIEHLISRLNPRRHEYVKGEKRHVIACHACNHEKGREECLALPRGEEIRRGVGRNLETWFKSWFWDLQRFECF